MLKPSKKQIEAYTVYNDCGCNVADTAAALGINVNSLKKTLFNGHRAGLTIPTEFCKHLPAGIGLDGASIYVHKDGGTSGWFKGSALVDDSKKLEKLLSFIDNRKSIRECNIKPPSGVDKDIQLEWTLADLHYGMLAWDKETGADYDIKIARELLLDSASDIFARSGKVKETVLVLMGDNFHTDFKSNQTEKSHHSLDVDSRYTKIMYTGTSTYIDAIEICLQFSEKVKVIVLYGNHDSHSSSVLPMLFYFNFKGTKNEKRVLVDMSPAKEHYNRWGSVITIYHHGDGTKPDRVCYALNDYILENDLTGIRYRYAKQAHLHTELIRDIGKITYESVPSPVADDSFASGANFISKKATVATVYHKIAGEMGRYSITPQCLAWKKDNIS